ncbi:hypothetical protein ABDZ32_11540 [Aeromonas veronii]|uniref:hypothetical protein n=1 Tax=Aeromonas veronii TaxID=654 RepID=UPI0031FC470C
MYLSSFSLVEPEGEFYFYQPSWLNVWEAHLYDKALKSTQANGWGFKRFGTEPDIYAGEMVRNPQYQKYLDAMEQAADATLHGLSTKARMKLLKSRTALIYADSWGESGLFENISSILHISMIDTLPKTLVKKFAVKELTCKVRGEKYAFIQAMRIAQDYLCWNVFDNVVICAAYRAIPVLTFSAEETLLKRGGRKMHRADDVNLTVERVGCFIFSQQKSSIRISDSQYMKVDTPADTIGIDQVVYAGLNKQWLQAHHSLQLVDLYGSSGCLTPALSFVYLQKYAERVGKLRTIIPDHLGGACYFDIEYCNECLQSDE